MNIKKKFYIATKLDIKEISNNQAAVSIFQSEVKNAFQSLNNTDNACKYLEQPSHFIIGKS